MNVWSKAQQLANATPASRNRYIDFLRAASILFVVVGHWLMSTAVYNAADQSLTPVSTLAEVPWTQWLTWVFQVMPIFFIVGGYANGLSLQAARKKGQGYADWLRGRLQRLLSPLVFLLIAWAFISCVLHAMGMPTERVAIASQLALVPTWFLACYALIVMLAPFSYQLWHAMGFYSLTLYAALAIATDLLVFATGNQWLALTNYLWVWLAIHHLGFAWLDGRIGSKKTMLLISAGAALALLALVSFGPYSIAMAGAPEGELSNSLPPKMTLLALGLMQFGLVVTAENFMHRVLQNATLWTATVLISSMIMSIYLWHMTVLLAGIASAHALGGIGLNMQPGSAIWWFSRPLWMTLLGLALLPTAMLLSPLERLSQKSTRQATRGAGLVLGCMIASTGIAIGSNHGYNGDVSSPLFIISLGLALGGAALCGVKPWRRQA